MNSALKAEFLEAVHTRQPVRGLTHGFYRYPARFSPLFARAAIRAFTQPGDVVFDPFMGGGTTLVEASILGRRSIGTDISNLAVFISRVKTTLLSEEDLARVRSWAADLPDKLNLHNPAIRASSWLDAGYQRNISGKTTWPIRKTLELALAEVGALACTRQQRFARCVWLKTAQWALDCRTKIPSAAQFRIQFFRHLNEMTENALEYAAAARDADLIYNQQGPSRTLCLGRSVVGIEKEQIWENSPAPALILTSPPYPGVHVLYHRWQVHGRRETPAPFWIANTVDGNGASFYTLGGRRTKNLTGYYQGILACFASMARIASHSTLVVQMVAFSDPSWQLPRYLGALEQAGYAEVHFPDFANSSDGRQWRQVPNRKWYADQRGAIAASKEVVLFHRLEADRAG